MKNSIITTRIICVTIAVAFVATLSAFRLTDNPIKKADYNVTIYNRQWKSMRIQVRVGNQSIPGNNALVKNEILQKDGSVTVPYDVLCYYRRDADPDHPNDKDFTSWTSAGCFRNKTCTVENP